MSIFFATDSPQHLPYLCNSSPTTHPLTLQQFLPYTYYYILTSYDNYYYYRYHLPPWVVVWLVVWVLVSGWRFGAFLLFSLLVLSVCLVSFRVLALFLPLFLVVCSRFDKLQGFDLFGLFWLFFFALSVLVVVLLL